MNAPLKGKELAAFRKMSAEDQVRALRGQKVERVFTVDRANGIDEAARTVWLSIASDAPYMRWWGEEVLDMAPGSIRQDRLKLGAPLLVGHDSADQVGVVESYEITSDKKLRVLARFGRSARAEDIFRDVLDGIRRNASVGYIIHDLILEKQVEDVATYRVTDWEPLEGSLVAVPADPTVGVGRELELPAPPTPIQETTMNEAELKAKQEAEARAKAEAELKAKAEQDAVTRERERVSSLSAAGREYADLGGPEVAEQCVKDGSTVDVFKARILEKIRARQRPPSGAEPGTGALPGSRASYGEGARVRFRYGQLRAFTKPLILSNGAKMEAEEAAYRAGMWMAGTLFGKDWGRKWMRENGLDVYTQDESGQVRVMGEGALSTGGALVPVEMEQAVIDLRDSYGVARRLVRVRPMASSQKSIPRRTGGVTAYFFDDEDGTGITASDKSWSNVNLVAKKLGALARISEDLEEDAVIDVVDDLANEIAYAFAVKEDQCMLDGDGTSTYGGMTGFRTKFAATAYASRISLTAGHDTFPEVDATDLASVQAGPAAYGKPMAKWLTSETGASLMFDRLMSAAGGNTVVTLAQGIRRAYNGYEIVTSEAMPSGPNTDYSNAVMAMFGRFDLAASLGNRRGITLQVLRERYAELGQIGIKGTERFDLVVHDLGSTTVKGPVAAAYGN